MFTVLLTSLFAAVPLDAQDTGKRDSPKVLAKTPTSIANTAVVIKRAEQLGKLRNADPGKASAELANMLKVEAIDWKKQMVINISGGTQRTGGYSVEAKSLEVKDGKLI